MKNIFSSFVNVGFSHIRGVEIDLCFYNIPKIFKIKIKENQNKEIVCFPHEKIDYTWTEFIDQIETTSSVLYDLGFRYGDRFGIWLPNVYDWLRFGCASMELGGICTNINPAYRGIELKHSLKLIGVSMLIMIPRLKTISYNEILKSVINLNDRGEIKSKNIKLSTLKYIFCSSFSENNIPGTMNVNELYSKNYNKKIKRFESYIEFDDSVNIQFTSGTTGSPKGATLTHINIINNALFVGMNQKLTDKDCMILPIPLYHCFGIVMGFLTGLLYCCRQVWPGPLFQSKDTLKAIQEQFRASVLYGVPTMLLKILGHINLTRTFKDKLRSGIAAGALIPPHIMKRLNTELNLHEMTICYGMTETSPVSFQSTTDTPFNKKCYTIGKIHPNVDVKLIDENNKIVSVGETGELCTKGYVVMKGYWNQKKTTKESIDWHGYMHTGDLAIIDDEGYVQIIGRRKDMIIRAIYTNINFLYLVSM